MQRLNVSINRSDNTFAPKWWVSLLYLLLLAVFLSLGIWQLDRGEQKRQILNTYQQHLQQPPVPLSKVTHVPAQHRFQAVTTDGSYDNGQQFLLDNQFYQHRLGFYVLTPFKPMNSERWILIDRGWLQGGASRQQLPSLSAIPQRQKIIGRIYIPSEKQLVLSNKQDNPGAWPRVIQKIDFKQQSQMLGKPLYPFVLRLNPDQRYGYVRDWPIVNNSPSKHKAYALQWFAFGFVLIILFVAIHLKRKEAVDN